FFRLTKLIIRLPSGQEADVIERLEKLSFSCEEIYVNNSFWTMKPSIMIRLYNKIRRISFL
ncbi:hypothetical protein Bpfe_007995, partial [Biomphalaria pfeifferi]